MILYSNVDLVLLYQLYQLGLYNIIGAQILMMILINAENCFHCLKVLWNQ